MLFVGEGDGEQTSRSDSTSVTGIFGSCEITYDSLENNSEFGTYSKKKIKSRCTLSYPHFLDTENSKESSRPASALANLWWVFKDKRRSFLLFVEIKIRLGSCGRNRSKFAVKKIFQFTERC